MADASGWIAVVDDDPAVLKGLSRLLRSRALRHRIFESGQKFLSTLSEGLPDCLIVDLQMPEMNGIELQQHLLRNGFQIPTIVITAHGGTTVRERCEAAGAIAFLLKPVQDTSLFEAINTAMGIAGTRT
jgi:FixJ family two-component response regulator